MTSKRIARAVTRTMNRKREAAELKPITMVFTGGPCGGKSTAIAHAVEMLEQLGFNVLIVPESATIIKNMGMRPILPRTDMQLSSVALTRKNQRTIASFQEAIISENLRHEDTAMTYAVTLTKHTGRRTVIIIDRGIVDVLAYCSYKTASTILKKYGLTVPQARDNRYDHVFHLVTAALGTDCYSTENNGAREETAQEAIDADERTRQVWHGHDHVVCIDNTTPFDGKIARLLEAMRHALGIPHAIENEIKWLVKVDASKLQAEMRRLNGRKARITQTYLLSPSSVSRRIRQRTLDGNTRYFFTEKKDVAGTKGRERIEREMLISHQDYVSALSGRNPQCGMLSKDRWLFSVPSPSAGSAQGESAYFHLDTNFSFEDGKKNGGTLVLLEREFSIEGEEPWTPPFCEIIADVTNDKTYSNFALSMRCA